MRGYFGAVTMIAMLCGSGPVGCGGGLEEGILGERSGPEEGIVEDTNGPQGGIEEDTGGPDAEPYRIIAHGTMPGVPSELSGMTLGDGFFFAVHRNNDNGHMVITQLAVEDWRSGKLKNLAQGSVRFSDPEGLSYIDKQGAAWRFVAAAEGGHLTIVEMNGNTVTLKADKQVGTYGNDGIEGVCYYDGYVYYGIQKDGQVYRVRFDSQKGSFGDKIESVISAATSVRDMTVIGAGLYSISGTRLTRVAGMGNTEIRNPITLRQLEGVAYAPAKGMILVAGEPNEYGLYTYKP